MHELLEQHLRLFGALPSKWRSRSGPGLRFLVSFGTCLNPSSSAWESPDTAAGAGVADAGVEMETASSGGSLFDLGNTLNQTIARIAVTPIVAATTPVAISQRDGLRSSSNCDCNGRVDLTKAFSRISLETRRGGNGSQLLWPRLWCHVGSCVRHAALGARRVIQRIFRTDGIGIVVCADKTHLRYSLQRHIIAPAHFCRKTSTRFRARSRIMPRAFAPLRPAG